MTSMSESARFVADSAQDFAEGLGGVARARAVRDRGAGYDRAAWRQISDLGWLRIGVAEAVGGLDMGEEELCALVESAGRTLLPEPLVPAIAAARLLADCGTQPAVALLDELFAGAVNAVPWEAAAGEGAPLRAAFVPDCHEDTQLLIGAAVDAGFSVRALTPEAPGVQAEIRACVDGSPLATLDIAPAAWNGAPLLASGAAARAMWERARDTMLLGHAAYLVGVMDQALRMTLDYLKLRTQFGVPIGSFQALQHRAVDCHIDIAATRALVYEVARAFGTVSRARAAAAAKARASAGALRVCKACIQMHGAIGFTDEHDIGLYLKKAMTLAARQGGALAQKLRYAELARCFP